VADDFGARLIFDAAHGYGAVRDGVHVGGLGDAEVFSLSGTKPVTSAEGGLIATKDPEILRRIKLLRGYGFLNDYETKVIGLNGKMSELHAALGLLTMQRVDDALAVRDGHVARYHRLLGDLSELRRQVIRPQDRSTFKDFALIFEETAMRDSVELAMGATDIQTKRYFRPCHTMSAYGAFDVRPMPVTESVYSRILCVPLFETLTDEQIDLVCSTVRRAIVAA
jgi:dTDP-4-amino-4,6-dideoxygalactose transaminase